MTEGKTETSLKSLVITYNKTVFHTFTVYSVKNVVCNFSKYSLRCIYIYNRYYKLKLQASFKKYQSFLFCLNNQINVVFDQRRQENTEKLKEKRKKLIVLDHIKPKILCGKNLNICIPTSHKDTKHTTKGFPGATAASRGKWSVSKYILRVLLNTGLFLNT